MSIDIFVKDEGAFSVVSGATEQGDEFVDAWILGVLSVQDIGRISITSEVAGQLAATAAEQGLDVERG